MIRILSRALLWILGWTVEDTYPKSLKKYIMVAIPHTSTWDFPIGLMVRSVINLDVKYIGKDSLFKPPFGFLFYWLGGYPVDRSGNKNFVDAVANIYNEKEAFAILIAPEGTREKVDKLKTGFYYIALKAKIPIIYVGFDFSRKIASFSEPFDPSGDLEKDIKFAESYFLEKDIKGKNPEKGWPICLQ